MTTSERHGKFELRSVSDGDRLVLEHLPSGDQFGFDADGGVVPQGHDTLPASPVDRGVIYYDRARGIPAWWDRDHYEWPSFVDDVLIEPQTVSGTTTTTTVWDPGINAGSLLEGRTYQLDLMGKFSTANTSSEFTVDVNLAAATVAGISNTGGNVTDAPWSVEFTFTVRADGANGTLQPHTRGLFNSEAADAHGDPVAVDTTTATELSVDLTWNDGSAGNSTTLGQAHLKQMG